MPRSASNIETKVERLRQLEVLLLSHPGGMSQAEAARLLGVDRSTINRYTLSDPHIQVDEHGWISIDRSTYLVDVRFTLHEALALHLASRLLAARMDRHNPHAAAAVRKLGLALNSLAPMLSRSLIRSAGSLDSDDQWPDEVYRQNLERLTEAWAAGRKIRIRYVGLSNPEGRDHIVCPYFIEPLGQSTYLIGRSEEYAEVRTYKIERIAQVELLAEHYTIPADFDALELLSGAWGIWTTAGEPVEVELRFSPQVARRVRETRWHRSQIIETCPDGSLTWRARVSEPREMLYWVRGWGPEVEVISPPELARELYEEARRAAALYAERFEDSGVQD